MEQILEGTAADMEELAGPHTPLAPQIGFHSHSSGLQKEMILSLLRTHKHCHFCKQKSNFQRKSFIKTLNIVERFYEFLNLKGLENKKADFYLVFNVNTYLILFKNFAYTVKP